MKTVLLLVVLSIITVASGTRKLVEDAAHEDRDLQTDCSTELAALETCAVTLTPESRADLCIECALNTFPETATCDEVNEFICEGAFGCSCGFCSTQVGDYLKCSTGCDGCGGEDATCRREFAFCRKHQQCCGTLNCLSNMCQEGEVPKCKMSRKMCKGNDNCCSQRCLKREKKCK
jgi:hypothetical protein